MFCDKTKLVRAFHLPHYQTYDGPFTAHVSLLLSSAVICALVISIIYQTLDEQKVSIVLLAPTHLQQRYSQLANTYAGHASDESKVYGIVMKPIVN